MKKIYKAHILFTKEKNRFEILENGYIAVDDDGRILAISSTPDGVTTPSPCGRVGEGSVGEGSVGGGSALYDFGDRLLIPAMNDLHVHASQYRNQGIAMDLELLPWLQNYTFPEEMKYADIHYAERMYRRFVHDLWRFGTMRSCVFATIHTAGTRLLMQLFQEAGMGALVGKVAMNRNCPTALCEDPATFTAGQESIIAEANSSLPTPHSSLSPLHSSLKSSLNSSLFTLHSSLPSLVRPIITPRFIPSCTPEMLRACGELAAKYQLPVQSHLSENRDEIAWVAELEPESTSYGDAYDRYGLFGQTPTVMAHCVWTDGEELELMKRRGVMVAHCPTSNFNVASGMAPIRRFLNEGLRVGLGSDISGGHDLSIFRMMVYAIQVSKMHYQQNHDYPFLSLSEAFWLATKSAGSFFGKVGSFEPGYEFDALVIDDSDLNHDHYSLLERLERFIYLGDDRHIQHRFCRGQEIPEPTK